MIEYISDGYMRNGDRAVLWRIADYIYQIEIGSGIAKYTINLNDTEYYDALEALANTVEEVTV